MVARIIAIVHACIFDAWSAYNKEALGMQLGGSPPTAEIGTDRSQQKEAISFAAYGEPAHSQAEKVHRRHCSNTAPG